MLIARGDYEHHEHDVTWDQLHREMNAFRRSDYYMSVSDANGPQSKVNLQWRKDKSKSLATVYDCVDGNGKVVAMLRSGGGFRTRAKPQTPPLIAGERRTQSYPSRD